MASVSNVKLQIGQANSETRRSVSVTYKLCFSACEASAGSTFVEKVVLRGDDPFWDDDDHLITLRNVCTKAVDGCVERSISTTIARSALDEDPDTIIFGWVIGSEDEIYARVSLAPFVAKGSSKNSNILTGHFGPAGP